MSTRQGMNNKILKTTSDIQSYSEEQPVHPVLGDKNTGTDYTVNYEVKIFKPETLRAIKDVQEGKVVSAKDEYALFDQLNA